MQNDVISEILSVEEHAQKLEQEAQSKSREMVIAAQDKANQYVRDAVNAKREADRKELEKAESEAKSTLDAYISTLDTSVSISFQEADALADKIVRRMCASEIFSPKKEA